MRSLLDFRTKSRQSLILYTMTSGGLVWRSLGMLRAVRGLIGASLLLGVIASALPYVSAAAFGPMVQVIAEAGEDGNLSGVWDLRGPLVARDDGLLRSVAGSVPFGVLLATWAGALLLTQLMYFVNTWVGAKVDRITSGGHPATRPRPHANAVAGLLQLLAQRRTDAAGDRRTGWCATASDRLSASAADRHGGADRRHRLSGGHLMADDGRRACADTAGAGHPEGRRPRCPGGDAAGDERRPCDGRRAGTDDQRNGRDPDIQCRAVAQQAVSRGFRALGNQYRNLGGVDAGHGERVSGVRRAEHRRGVARRHRVQREFRSDAGGPDRVHRDGPDDVRRRAAGDGRLHHVSLGGAERGVDLRVARHPTFGAGRRRTRSHSARFMATWCSRM